MCYLNQIYNIHLNSFFPTKTSTSTSKPRTSSTTMSDYRIQTCSWTDMDDLQSLSANTLRNSPLTNALLTNPPGSNRSNTVHTRHTLAHFIYLQALQAPASTSIVIKAINTRTPTHEMQACAWLQFYRPDAPNHIEEDVAEAPDCIDGETWKYIERIRHSSRKILMNEAPHYCKPSPPTTHTTISSSTLTRKTDSANEPQFSKPSTSPPTSTA